MACSRARSLLVAGLIAVGVCSVDAAIIVRHTLTTRFDVDNDLSSTLETSARSAWVEDNALGLGVGGGKFRARYWIETTLIDFLPVCYEWGPLGGGVIVTGRFNAASFFGFTIGSQKSQVMWSPVTTNSNYTTRSADILFDVQNCVITCATLYLKTGKASYHDIPAGSPIVPAGGGWEGAPEAAGGVGPIVTTGAVIELADDPLDENETPEIPARFASTVERTAPDEFVYTYRVINDTALPVEFAWEAAGLSGPLGAHETAERTVTSPLPPIEVATFATISFVGQFEQLDLGGPVQTVLPLPEPVPAFSPGGLAAMVFTLVGAVALLLRRSWSAQPAVAGTAAPMP